MNTCAVYFSCRKDSETGKAINYTYLYAFYDKSGDLLGFREESSKSHKDLLHMDIIFQSKAFKCTSVENQVITTTKRGLKQFGKFTQIGKTYIKAA